MATQPPRKPDPGPVFRPEGPRPALHEWRAVAGIGPRRALDLARARWAAGDRPFDPRTVRGVGEATAAKAAEFLERRRKVLSAEYTDAFHGSDPAHDPPAPDGIDR